MELQNGRPENINDRLDKEIRVYDFLDKLDIDYQRVESTYRKALSRKIPLYQKVCCNFEKLERKSKKYDPNYVPSKKKIRATVPSK